MFISHLCACAGNCQILLVLGSCAVIRGWNFEGLLRDCTSHGIGSRLCIGAGNWSSLISWSCKIGPCAFPVAQNANLFFLRTHESGSSLVFSTANIRFPFQTCQLWCGLLFDNLCCVCAMRCALVFAHSMKPFCQRLYRLAISYSASILYLMQTHFIIAMVLAHMHLYHIDRRMYVCRAEDYWEGYKLFCYAYYSHSLQHELQFQQSKLGLSMSWAPSSSCASYFQSSCHVCYCFSRLCSIDRGALLLFHTQGALCGNVIVFYQVLPTIPSATHAHNYFHLWKCIASMNCKRIAAICVHSCFVLTLKMSWSLTS